MNTDWQEKAAAIEKGLEELEAEIRRLERKVSGAGRPAQQRPHGERQHRRKRRQMERASRRANRGR